MSRTFFPVRPQSSPFFLVIDSVSLLLGPSSSSGTKSKFIFTPPSCAEEEEEEEIWITKSRSSYVRPTDGRTGEGGRDEAVNAKAKKEPSKFADFRDYL